MNAMSERSLFIGVLVLLLVALLVWVSGVFKPGPEDKKPAATKRRAR